MTILEERPTQRRVTPTARLVLSADAPRADWLAARHRGIGSSDIASVLGYHKSNLHVFYNKTGMLPDDEDAGEYALWGTLHEDTIAREWARRNRSAVRRVGLVAQDTAPWRMCTLDRRVTVCPLNTERRESCALEIKTRNAFIAKDWRKGVPDDVLAQVLWQSQVTGYDHVHVACLIGGNDYRQFTILASKYKPVIENITTGADKLWHEHIVPKVAPAPIGDPDALVELYDYLSPGRSGVVHLDRNIEAFGALSEYLEASAIESDAIKRKKAAKAGLIAALGDNEVGAFGDVAAYTYTSASRTHIDAERLAEHHPDAYEDCASERSSRRLNVTNEYRKKVGNR